jgi:uncharacterized caspase-like protein
MNKLHYAVVVGINRYPGIRDLKYARQDAEDFYAWLTDRRGGAVPKRNVVLITVPDEAFPRGTPRSQAKPIKTQIEDALYEFRTKLEDHLAEEPADWHKTRLYFFASGHGIAPTPDEAALLMADSGPDHYGRNFSSAKYLSFFQKGQFFKELVFFADCCRERVANAPINGPDWTEVPGQNGELLTLRGFATYFGELAFEPQEQITDPDQLRGYFTKALLQGLREAVNPETHEIDSVSLAEFVTQRVQVLTADLPKPQKPSFITEPVAPRIVFKQKIPVKTIDNVLTHTVRLIFPANFKGKVNLFDGDHNLIASHEVEEPSWEIPLANGIYRVKLADGSSPFVGNGFIDVIGAKQDVTF